MRSLDMIEAAGRAVVGRAKIGSQVSPRDLTSLTSGSNGRTGFFFVFQEVALTPCLGCPPHIHEPQVGSFDLSSRVVTKRTSLRVMATQFPWLLETLMTTSPSPFISKTMPLTVPIVEVMRLVKSLIGVEQWQIDPLSTT